MHLTDIITPETIAVQVRIADKAHALRFAAASLGARSKLAPERIGSALAAREALGSTGIGRGVAVPHVCLAGLDRPHALLCTLAAPIDFESIDGLPVDIVFAMITPSKTNGGGEGLRYLAAMTRMLRDSGLAAEVRQANNAWNIYSLVVKFSSATAQFVS